MKKLILFFAFSVCAFAQTAHSNTLTWAWSQGTGDPATGFHIWKVAISGTTCPAFGTSAYATITGTTTLTYKDTVVVAGQTWCYGVTAYNAGGESSMSNVVSATTPFSLPTAPSSLQIVSQ